MYHTNMLANNSHKSSKFLFLIKIKITMLKVTNTTHVAHWHHKASWYRAITGPVASFNIRSFTRINAALLETEPSEINFSKTLITVQKFCFKMHLKMFLSMSTYVYSGFNASNTLTHLLLNKMAVISQMTFSNAFSWMKSLVLWFKFHWSLFLRVQLTISQHWFR